MMNNLWMEIDSDGRVLNVIRYDGISPYDPGEDIMLVQWDEDVKPWIGWTITDNGWISPDKKEGNE